MITKYKIVYKVADLIDLIDDDTVFKIYENDGFPTVPDNILSERGYYCIFSIGNSSETRGPRYTELTAKWDNLAGFLFDIESKNPIRKYITPGFGCFECFAERCFTRDDLYVVNVNYEYDSEDLLDEIFSKTDILEDNSKNMVRKWFIDLKKEINSFDIEMFFFKAWDEMDMPFDYPTYYKKWLNQRIDYFYKNKYDDTLFVPAGEMSELFDKLITLTNTEIEYLRDYMSKTIGKSAYDIDLLSLEKIE